MNASKVPYRYPTPADSPPPAKVEKSTAKRTTSPSKQRASQQKNGFKTPPGSPSRKNNVIHDKIVVTPPKNSKIFDRIEVSPRQTNGVLPAHVSHQPTVTKNSVPPAPPAPVTTMYVDPRQLQRSQPAPIEVQNVSSSRPNSSVAVVIPTSSKLSTLASSQFSTPTPQEPSVSAVHRPSSQKQPTPSPAAVAISGLQAASHRTNYQGFTTTEQDVAVSQKRKRDIDDVGDLTDVRIDQRARSEEALRTLEYTIAEISRMEACVKARDAVDTSFYFIQTPYNEEDTLVLTYQVQDRLESAIARAIDASSFSKAPVAGLIKIQRICESTLSLIEALTLSIDGEASADDVDEWLQRVKLAENSLHAARILLRILTAGREDKELYSENTLQTIAECLEFVMNRAIIPIVECRSTGHEEGQFKIYSANKKSLSSLFNMYGQTLRLLSDLVGKVDVEAVIYKIQDLSTKLIFVENAYTDRDSALGTARFEKLRTRAMHVVASIFHRYPAQRQLIFNEIVTSLEKVPVARQSARQFKAHEGKSIQLVSALLMRLVQTSATRSTSTRKHADSQSKHLDADADFSEDGESVRGSSPVKAAQNGDMEINDELELEEAEFDLRKLAEPLYSSALTDATYLIQYLVGRAQNTTKSGDQPYRKLLEIFVEDFISVLGLPMWPGAEMLLRALLSKLFRILGDDKSPVPAKNMALDVLGTIGSGIIDLQMFVEHACRAGEGSDSRLTVRLAGIANEYLEHGSEQQVNKFRGPYRVMMEYLHSQSLNDVQAPSARGLHLTQWAKTTLVYLSRDDEARPEVAPDLPMQLRNMILDSDWLQNEYDAVDATITPAQARLAASIITIASPTGRHFANILDHLISFMTSPQSNLKSRSLKSVTELIEKDPAILERNRSVLHSIIKGMQDSSPQVRDSALILLDKCLVLKPKLADVHVYTRIIQLASDDSKSVRKHAMKILKEIYLRSNDQNLQAHISAALMARVNDIEANVAEVAQQTFEELWMVPFHKTSRKDAVQREVELKAQVVLIVKTVQRGDEAVDVLDILLHNVLIPESKARNANLEVCKDMVRLMFDEIIDNEERPDRPSQQHLAQALTVFAKAEPKLFTSEQLRLLIPYLQNLTTVDHLTLYRFVAIIMRHVIPTLSLADRELLQEIQSKMMDPIARLGKEELAEAAACLWTVHGILKNERIVALMRSALLQVDRRKDLDFKDPANDKALNHLKRYMAIAGYFGRECNFDEYAELFRAVLPAWKGDSVSALVIDLFCPFTRQRYPQVLREAALDSIATICQSWPQHYQRPDVSTAFDLVFRNEDRRFMQVVLSGFLLFFRQEERKSDTGAEIKVGEGAKKGSERLQKSFIAGDSDAGATTIAQKFLQHILRVARSSTDELAVIATQVIASINRQGLVHPKKCGPVLVILETSTNRMIAEIAFAEHKMQHQKHETVFDKEYMRAIQQTFEYQRDIIQDSRGVTLQPTTPKLHMLFDVLKLGSGKVRKRFLGNLVSRLDFELPKLEVAGAVPDAVLFTRFILENLSFFDYARLDELLHLVSCLEKLVVHGVGTTVAHAIEIEILKVQLPQATQGAVLSQTESADHPMGHTWEPATEPSISAYRLRHLTVASMILSMIWETRTHLRQLWGLAKQNKNGAKPQAKDLNKPATKTPFYRSELLEKIEAIMAALDDPAAQLAQCKTFAEIVAVDQEHKIASEEDDAEAELARQAAGYETPEEEHETASNVGSTGKGRKRKGSVGPAGTPSAKRTKNIGETPKKRGKPKGPLNRQLSKTASADEDDDF
jgi:cohesin loading factor subunit SCC2